MNRRNTQNSAGGSYGFEAVVHSRHEERHRRHCARSASVLLAVGSWQQLFLLELHGFFPFDLPVFLVIV